MGVVFRLSCLVEGAGGPGGAPGAASGAATRRGRGRGVSLECHLWSFGATIHLIHSGCQGRHHVGHVGDEALD